MKRTFIMLIACLIVVGCSSEPKPIPKFALNDILCMEGMPTFRMKVAYVHEVSGYETRYRGIPAYGDNYLSVKESMVVLCTQESQ